MQLIMIGCEYVGKTTLGEGIMNWLRDTVGADTGWHDHFTLPTLERGKNLIDVEKAKTILELLETCPRLVEQYQRFQHEYHIQPTFFKHNDHLLVNWYYADAVYCPLYYPDLDPSPRYAVVKHSEAALAEVAPEMILLHVTASADVIRDRMACEPREMCPIKDPSDIEAVLDGFAEAFQYSLLRHKITVDTSSLSEEETLKDFLDKVEPHLQSIDLERIICHEALKRNQSGG